MRTDPPQILYEGANVVRMLMSNESPSAVSCVVVVVAVGLRANRGGEFHIKNHSDIEASTPSSIGFEKWGAQNYFFFYNTYPYNA